MVKTIMPTQILSPAKINLFLAITGKRDDGYHELFSLVAPLEFGDTLLLRKTPLGGITELKCDYPDIPLDDNNLVLKASRLYSEACKLDFTPSFTLEKRIPIGAGLGGGSSNAVAALKLLNLNNSNRLSKDDLIEIAKQIGSDCPLFFHDQPVLMRGRGEEILPLQDSVVNKFKGLPVLIFQPEFSISTRWAYAELAAHPDYYEDMKTLDFRWKNWLQSSDLHELPKINTFEKVVFRKYLMYNALNNKLKKLKLPVARLSGSGSACYILEVSIEQAKMIQDMLITMLGEDVTCVYTSLK